MNALNTVVWTSGVLAAFCISASAAELKITGPGTHELTENLTLRVTAHHDPDGLIRNELIVIGTNSEGAIVEDHCALTFGEGTWGVFAKGGTEGALITIADHWSVQTYDFYTNVGNRNEVHGGGLAGFNNNGARWSMLTKDLLGGSKIQQFSDPDVVEWAKALLPTLKEPPVLADEPKLEVRLVAEKEKEITMIRPTVARRAVACRQLGRFVKLGERLLEENEIEQAGGSTFGVLRENFVIQGIENQERYRQLCLKYKGRQAAFVSEGQVVELFTLGPDPKTFRFRRLGICSSRNPL